MIPGKQIYHAYFKDCNLVFTLIPKNANTSIKYALLKTFTQNKCIDDLIDDNIDKFHITTLPFFTFIDNQQLFCLNKECLKISIVRNPFDRLVAGWQNKIRFLKFNTRKRFGFNQACSFDMFIKQICSHSDKLINRHFIPQHNFIYNNEELISNEILKFETLNSDWNELQSDLLTRNNIQLYDLPLLNKSKNNYNNYHSYYTNELRKLVEVKFKKDLDLFEYQF